MEILFGNKGIYHYVDARVGSLQVLEENGYMYQVRMLAENELPYLLPCSVICSDGEVWLSHNTRECYSLQAILKQKKMTGVWLRQILTQILHQIGAMEVYLLDASDLVIDIAYLFYHKEKEAVRMLCVPGHRKPVKEQLRVLLEYFMPRFDHTDRAGERFLYECHRVLSDEWCDMTAFVALLNQSPDSEISDSCMCSEEKEAVREAPLERTLSKEEDVGTVFSKRFFLYVLAGGAALALIIKYLFFDGTTGTAIFGIVWLLALIVLAIMTVREKDEKEETDAAMREYKMQEEKQGETPLRKSETDQNVQCLLSLQKSGEKKDGVKFVPLTNGALEPFVIPTDSTSFTIGRDKTSDYRVATTQISRTHVRLFNRSDGLYIEDQNSTNGTYINAKRIPAMTERKLEKGDVVGLANEEFFIS